MNDRSKKLLFDIATACQEIRSFLGGVTLASYRQQVLIRRAVERNVTVIGEAMAQLRAHDLETFQRIPNGARIIATRHRAIHAYAAVNDAIIWEVASREAPALSQVIEQLLLE